MNLTRSEDLAPIAAKVLEEVSAKIAAQLPDVEVHHIGATAIPGGLTKGDLDVLLRVEDSEFHSAIERLRTSFAVKQAENWDPCFASFGSDTDYDLPVGVQLVVKDSEADFFLFVRDHLISNAEALAAYNRIKLEAADKSPDEYWSAKNRFLSSIVALKATSGNMAEYDGR